MYAVLRKSYQPVEAFHKYPFDELKGSDSYGTKFQLIEVSFITQGKWFTVKLKRQTQLPNGIDY